MELDTSSEEDVLGAPFLHHSDSVVSGEEEAPFELHFGDGLSDEVAEEEEGG